MLRTPDQPADDPTAAPLAGLIGASQAMLEVYATTRRVACSNASVLLLGETGTGKELIARAIHSCSLRSKKAFIPVDCAVTTGTLFASHTFGHVQGLTRGGVVGGDRRSVHDPS